MKSFRLLETDLTANLEGTKEIDQNGEVAALIKVITTETGFLFDVGMMGIVRQVQKPGEIWLYVPHGIQRISINHQKLGRLAEPYYFPIPIIQARTYELELTTNKVRTIIEEDAGGGFLSLNVTPAGAIVFIDDKLQTLKSDGTLSTFLLYGTHSYRVEASGYKAEAGTVNIVSEDTQVLDITLQSTQSNVTLVAEGEDAEIWINNELKGMGRWTGNLDAGAYIVETRKDGCRPQRVTLTVSEQEERTLTLKAPVPIVGKIRTESDPSGTEVFLGDKRLGVTPAIFKDIPVGTRQLLFRKNGYEDKTAEVTVEEGQIATVTVELTPLSGTATKEQKTKTKTKTETEPKPKPATPDLKPETSNLKLFSPLSLYGGASVQAGKPLAAGASLDAYLKGFNVEGSVGIPFGSSVPVSWTTLDELGFATGTVIQYYSPKLQYGLHIGYGIPVGRRLRLTPRVGVSSLVIQSAQSEYAQSTYVLSGVAALRTELAFSRKVGLHITPQYNIPVMQGPIAASIRRDSSDISAWNNGFALTAGLWINLFSK